MKNEKGITLVSLVIYIIVMVIVLGVMSIIIDIFYENTNNMQVGVQELVEFNKFNICFLKEIKTYDNAIDRIDEDNTYILFNSGNSFSINNNVIFYNNVKVCEGVSSFFVAKGYNGDEVDETIVNVTVEFENFSKTINYKIENIY